MKYDIRNGFKLIETYWLNAGDVDAGWSFRIIDGFLDGFQIRLSLGWPADFDRTTPHVRPVHLLDRQLGSFREFEPDKGET